VTNLSPLRSSAVAGVKWTSAATAITLVLQFVQLSVLAHFLSPEDFGLMASVVVVAGLAQSFADMGLSKVIIARQNTTDDAISSLFWLNVLAGVLVFVAVLGSTPLVVAFYDEPELSDLMPWVAAAFMVAALGQLSQSVLQRDLHFDRLATAELGAVVAGMAVAIVSASQGAGALALVWGLLVHQAVRAALVVSAASPWWRPRLHFRTSEVRGHVGFGLYQMGERSINYLYSNVDYLLIGRFLGAEALGAYSIAYQLAVLPLLRLNPVLTRVAFPVFAKKQQDDAALRRGFAELIRLVAFVVFPLLVGLSVAAPQLVPLAFGDEWSDSIPLIQILAGLGALKAVVNPVGPLLLAKDRPDVGFKMNAFMLVVTALALWTVVGLGVAAVAWTYLGVVAISFLVWCHVLRAVVGFGLHDYLSAIGWPALLALGMGAAMEAAYLVIRQGVAEPATILAILALAGVASYAVLVVRYRRRYLAELWTLARSGTPSRRQRWGAGTDARA
jgi:O-antigen/teichoic acid export membrane protein